MSEDFNPNQTTTLTAKVGNVAVGLATKSPLVLIGLCLVGGLGYIVTQMFILTNKIEVLNYSIERSNKLTRERICVEEFRLKGVDTSACKTIGELQ